MLFTQALHTLWRFFALHYIITSPSTTWPTEETENVSVAHQAQPCAMP